MPMPNDCAQGDAASKGAPPTEPRVESLRMAAKLCPHIILEGTRLTHKTEIAFALNEHPRVVGPRKYRYHSPVVSAEWCAFTNLPWGRGLINFNADEESLALETYRTWMRLFELQRYYSWIVDRFHISTIAAQRALRGVVYDFDWLERRLAALNFRLIFCTRTPESFETARAARLRVSGNPAQYDDLRPFILEQDRMRELFLHSRLLKIELDVSHDNVALAADEIATWLETTGGLYCP